MSIRRFIHAVLWLLLAISIVVPAALYVWIDAVPTRRYGFETRVNAIRLKSSGQLPGVGWVDLLGRMGWRWMRDGRLLFVRPAGAGAEPCPVRWVTPLGRFWGAHEDGGPLEHIVLEQVGGRIYDRPPAAVRAGDVVYDVGAHLGTFTRFALDRGAEIVVAFEPQQTNIACLKRTFAPEIASGRVVVIEAAAWHSAATLSFKQAGPSTMGRVVAARDSPDVVAVAATTIDDITQRLRLPRVDFIKMDIEGAERHALAGARAVLARWRPRMVICTYHQPDDPKEISRVVQTANPRYQRFARGMFQAYFY